jgi:hypothetical protein
LSPAQRRYLFIQNGLGAAIVNAALNGAIAWAMMRRLALLPVWGVPGVVPDILVTAFGVTFGTCIFASLQVRWDVDRGRISPALSDGVTRVVARFPAGTFRRAFLLGAVSVVVFCPLVLAALALSGKSGFDRSSFIALKAVFSAVQGAVVTPLIVMGVLADRSRALVGIESR